MAEILTSKMTSKKGFSKTPTGNFLSSVTQSNHISSVLSQWKLFLMIRAFDRWQLENHRASQKCFTEGNKKNCDFHKKLRGDFKIPSKSSWSGNEGFYIKLKIITRPWPLPSCNTCSICKLYSLYQLKIKIQVKIWGSRFLPFHLKVRKILTWCKKTLISKSAGFWRHFEVSPLTFCENHNVFYFLP